MKKNSRQRPPETKNRCRRYGYRNNRSYTHHLGHYGIKSSLTLMYRIWNCIEYGTGYQKKGNITIPCPSMTRPTYANLHAGSLALLHLGPGGVALTVNVVMTSKFEIDNHLGLILILDADLEHF